MSTPWIKCVPTRSPAKSVSRLYRRTLIHIHNYVPPCPPPPSIPRNRAVLLSFSAGLPMPMQNRAVTIEFIIMLYNATKRLPNRRWCIRSGSLSCHSHSFSTTSVTALLYITISQMMPRRRSGRNRFICWLHNTMMRTNKYVKQGPFLLQFVSCIVMQAKVGALWWTDWFGFLEGRPCRLELQ